MSGEEEADDQIETKLAPSWSLKIDQAINFWLSTEDLPKPENRVTLTDDGAMQAELHLLQREAQEENYTTSSSPSSATSACTRATFSHITPT